jgi:integrase
MKSVWRSLQAVEGLRIGRSEAGEPEPVRPVPDREIEAIKPHVSRQVWALIQLQLLTGARPGELLVLRPIDLDTGGGKVWTSKPAYHKTAWHGHGRTIYFGPEAQKILKQFMPRKADGSSRTDAYLFSPAEAEQERLAALHARRLTPMNQGNKPGSNRVDDPETSPRDRYDIASYRRAIARACLRVHPLPVKLRRQKDEKLEDYRKRMAGPDGAEVRTWRREHCWHPHQLRHNAATRLRREFGIDLAQTILGHRVGSAITEIYTEANVAKAIEVVAKIG